jgi:hypothetical protein
MAFTVKSRENPAESTKSHPYLMFGGTHDGIIVSVGAHHGGFVR